MDCFDHVQVDFKHTLGELVKHRFERFSHLKGVVACVGALPLCLRTY